MKLLQTLLLATTLLGLSSCASHSKNKSCCTGEGDNKTCSMEGKACCTSGACDIKKKKES